MQKSVASKLAKARDAADRAVARCDVARNDAVRLAALVVAAGDDVKRRDAAAALVLAAAGAGDDVEARRDAAAQVLAAGDVVGRRDAAALAAQDAAVRCAAASVAARETAACCEAVANQGAANHHGGDAAFAARQARLAADRCDVEGAAAAASQAANAFADSCAAACADAAPLTVVAKAAANRCVRATEDVAAAAWLARKTCIWRDVHKSRKAYRESVVFHKEASKDAVAAASAARRAAVRCAAASRRAVSAALQAREAASRCDVAHVDGAPAAAMAARRAVDRCVAAKNFGTTAAQVAPVVPCADEKADEARKAAESCDASLADPFADHDKDFVKEMRGWLMTVATLFVGIAIQAIAEPPSGMSFDHCGRFGKARDGASSGHSPANRKGVLECIYLVINTCTLSIALTLLVVLMTMKKAAARLALFYIQGMLVMLSLTVAASYIIGASGNNDTRLTTLAYLVFFSILVSTVPIYLFFSVKNKYN